MQITELEAAQAELQRLIDHPEKHLPVDVYRAHLKAAQARVNRARKAGK